MKLFRCLLNEGGVVIVMAFTAPEAYNKAVEYLSIKGVKTYNLQFHNVIEHHSDCVFYTFN